MKCNAKVAEATALTPYLAVRRLKRIAKHNHVRTDRHAIAWIAQAAELISAMAKRQQALILTLNNFTRHREKVVRIKEGRPVEVKKIDAEPRVGKVVKAGPNQAEAIADMIVGAVDLYRARNGGVRVVKAGAKVKQGEFLGRFDEGADYQMIVEAIND